MNKNSLLVLIVLLIVLVLSPSLYRYQEVVRNSRNWAPSHPAYYSWDQNSETWAGLTAEETGGWIEYRLEETQRIFGVELEAEIPESAWIFFDVLGSKHRKSIFSSFRSGESGRIFIDFGGQRVESDRMILNLEGVGASLIKIKELCFLSIPPSPSGRRGQLEYIENNSTCPFYYSPEFLIDGNLDTVWNPSLLIGTKPGGGGMMHGWAGDYNIDFFEGKQRIWDREVSLTDRHRGFWEYEDSAVFKSSKPGKYTDLSFYLNEGATGLFSLSLFSDNAWQQCFEVELSGLKGWQNICLPRERRIEKLKLEVAGRGLRPLVIGEIELWEEAQGFEKEYLEISGFSEVGEKRAGLFYLEKEELGGRVEVIAVISGEGKDEDTNIRLNGLKLYNPLTEFLGSSHILKFYPEKEMLQEAENFITIEPGENRRILTLSVNLEPGMEEFYIRHEEGDPDTFNLEDEIIIHSAIIYSGSSASAAAAFLSADGSLVPDSQESYFDGSIMRYTFETPVKMTGGRIQSEGVCGLLLDGTRRTVAAGIRLISSSDELLYGTSDYKKQRILINGINTRNLGNYFWLPDHFLDLPDSGTASVEIEKLEGDKLLESRTFEINRGGSTDSGLVLDLPAEVIYTLEDSYRIKGRAFGTNVRLFIDGIETQISNRIFEGKVSLKLGLNLIPVEMLIQDGESPAAVQFVSIFRVAHPLEIVLDAPVPGSTVRGPTIELRGHIENVIRLKSLEVNGEEAEWLGETYQHEINLPLPGDRIHIRAVDAFFGECVRTFLLRTDTCPPEITKVRPVDGSWVNSCSLSISGYVQDDPPLEVYINQRIASLQGDLFIREITLSEGSNQVDITAFDEAGNRKVFPTLTINCDITPPYFTDVSGYDTGWTNRNRQEILFAAEDIGSGIDHYEISVDDEPFQPQSSPFVSPILCDGLHTLLIRAYDKVDNYGDTEVKLMIDTVPPEGPDAFRVISGNNNGVVSWSDEPDDTVFYSVKGRGASDARDRIDIAVEKESGELSDDTEIRYFEFDLYDRLENMELSIVNGGEYSFSIRAIDRAGNISKTFYASLIPGGTVEKYDEEAGTVVEYENVKLLLGKDSLPEDVDRIVVTEALSPDIEGEAEMPLLSPIYSLSVISKGNEEQEHIEFEEEYIGRLDFDEKLIPEGYPEENIGVYYFDPLWSRWYRIPESVVDTENNRIYFRTNHFSLISIQPTVIKDLSPEEINTFMFSPFRKTTAHGKALISPHGGCLSTGMTEFVLPGVNGLDLVISRTYDTVTARLDATGLSANLNISLASIFNEGDLGQKISGKLTSGALSNFLEGVTDFFKKNGDYAYSVGQGWRLNFPYIRSTSKGMMLRSPSGSFFDINTMDYNSDKSTEGGGFRKLYFENHEREDFTFVVTQTLSLLSEASFIEPFLNGGDTSIVPTWYIAQAELIQNDGKSYSFDFLGRLTKIKDMNDNCITFHYDDLLLNHIVDSRGRKIRFEYNSILSTFCVPQIKKIWVEDDPREREVLYEYKNGQDEGVPGVLPLLTASVDCGGRRYDYDYDKKFLFSGNVGVKVNIACVMADLFSCGTFSAALSKFGLSSFTVHAGTDCTWVLPLSRMKGYQIGETAIRYKVEELYYADIDLDDYFLGFIPTAVDISAGRQTKLCAESLSYEDLVTGVGLTENWRFNYENGGDKQFYCSYSRMDDGYTVKEYSFKKITKYRPAWACLGDYITNLFKNRFVTRRPINPEIWGVEEKLILKDSQTGECLETVRKEWECGHLQPSEIRIERGDNFILKKFEYDKWGNITEESTTEKCRDSRLISRTLSLFNSDNDPVPFSNNQGAIDPPFADTFDFDSSVVRDRIIRRLVMNELPAVEEREKEIEYINLAWRYDEKGNVSGKALYQREGRRWAVTEYTLYPDGEVKSTKSPKGAMTHFAYDPNPAPGFYTETEFRPEIAQGDGTLLAVTNTTTYDDFSGNPVLHINERGFVTEYQYDGAGRPLVITYPDDNDDPDWNPLAVLNPSFRWDNPKMTIDYNDLEYSLKITNRVAAEKEFFYDDNGNVIQKVEYNRYPSEEIIESRMEYDLYGRLNRYIDPLGKTITYERDILGNVLKKTYPEVNGKAATVMTEYDYAGLSRVLTDENNNRRKELLNFSGKTLDSICFDSRGDIIRSSFVLFDSLGNQIAERNGRGYWTHFRWDSVGREISREFPQAEYRDRDGGYQAVLKLETRYDLDGYKSGETRNRRDRDITVRYEYNGLGQLITETLYYTHLSLENSDPVASVLAVTSYVYDEMGNQVKRIDPSGEVIERLWSASGNLLSETDPLNNSTTFTYDLGGRLISQTEPRGNCGRYPGLDFTIKYKYDDLDRLISGTLPANRFSIDRPETKFEYDARGALLQRTEDNGESFSYTYDNRGRCISENHSIIDDSKSYRKEMSYDAVGNLVLETFPGGLDMTYSYDELNRVVEVKHGGITNGRFTYDENDNLSSKTRAAGGVTFFRYDPFNRISQEEDPEGGIINYAYNEDGNRTWLEKSNGMNLLTEFDERGLALLEIQSGRESKIMQYDNRGIMLRKKDGEGNTLKFKYGKTGLLLTVVLEGETPLILRNYEYDESGFLIEAKEGEVITRYNFSEGAYSPDPLGLIYRKEEIVRGESLALDYNFDSRGHCIQLDYPSGEKKKIIRNGLGEILSIPGIIEDEIEYAENTYLSGYTFANGIRLNRSYDEFDRIAEITYKKESASISDFSYKYDPNDNIIALNQDAFSYDQNNQLIYASTIGKGSSTEFLYEGEFKLLYAGTDILGQKELSSCDKLSGEEIILDWNGGSLGLELGYACLIKKIILNPADFNRDRLNINNTAVYFSLYNQEGHWEECDQYSIRSDSTNGSIIVQFNSPQMARYIKIHSHYNPLSPSGIAEKQAAEIKVNKNVDVVVFISGGANNEYYKYDDGGNRAERISFGSHVSCQGYNYLPGTDLLQADGYFAYKYDRNRNLVEKGDVYELNNENTEIECDGEYKRYTYDPFYRLIRVEKLDPLLNEVAISVEYVYNYLGFRVMKKTSEKTVRYIFDEEGKVLEERISPGTSPAKENQSPPPSIRDYFYLGSKHIAYADQNETYFYGTDHLGTTALMTDASGQTVWTGAVTPFADGRMTTGLSESVKYTGKEWDEEAGMFYFNARWYDTNLGRFITEDPARDGVNWFVYCGNNPLGFVDPSGMVDVIAEFDDEVLTTNNYSLQAEARQQIETSQQDTRENKYYEQSAGGNFNRPAKGRTWCNQSTFDVAESLGVDLSTLLFESRWYTTANEAAQVLADKADLRIPDRYREVNEVGAVQAQELANKGYVVFVSWMNLDGGKGHIVTAVPSDRRFDQAVGPLVSNIGIDNEIMATAKAFGVNLNIPNTASSLSDIKYYLPDQSHEYNPSRVNRAWGY